jgi:aspartate carbamoyltransferase catalytic subunit
MDFKGRDIVSISDFDKDEINFILDTAERMIPFAKGERTSRALEGQILSTLFFEPSTRTLLSFTSAMHRLGGSVLGISEIEKSSVKKGETLVDTVRMAECYSDIIVLRHNREGAARLAAEYSDKPVINAGDGAGQHPTQTLLDLMTIRLEKGKIEGNNIALVGDLKYGRTVHSLSHALTLFGAKLTFVSPKSLTMPAEFVEQLKEMKADVDETTSIEDAVSDADVIYMTRIQKERFPDPAEYKKVAGLYRVDMNLLSKGKNSVIVMHPLPRVTEIATEVDATEKAKYFEQAFNGVPLRMALLALVSGADMGGFK